MARRVGRRGELHRTDPEALGGGGLGGLQLPARAVDLQLVLFWRVPPGALAPLLPDGLTPVVLRGHALLSMAYTRVAGRGGRWVARRLGAPVDTLAYRIPVEREGGARRRATYVPRRATTSWIEARFGRRLLGGSFAHARFRLEHDSESVHLEVACDGRPELVLRAAAAPGAPASALLRDRREVEALLRSTATALPPDPLAPEADAPLGTHAARLGLEPLLVHELRTPWLDAPSFLRERAAFDSAYRLRLLRRSEAPARSRALPALGRARAAAT